MQIAKCHTSRPWSSSSKDRASKEPEWRLISTVWHRLDHSTQSSNSIFASRHSNRKRSKWRSLWSKWVISSSSKRILWGWTSNLKNKNRYKRWKAPSKASRKLLREAIMRLWVHWAPNLTAGSKANKDEVTLAARSEHFRQITTTSSKSVSPSHSRNKTIGSRARAAGLHATRPTICWSRFSSNSSSCHFMLRQAKTWQRHQISDTKIQGQKSGERSHFHLVSRFCIAQDLRQIKHRSRC